MLTYSNGNTSDLGVVVGKDGAKGADGKDGADGVGISDVAVSTDGVLVITLSNGEVKTLGNIKGEKGEKGDKGDAGRGIAKTEIINGELWITYTDSATPVNLGKVSSDSINECLQFTRLDDGTLSVAIRDDCKDLVDDLSIPAYAYGKAVTQIAEQGFYRCKYLKNVTIPITITAIGHFAFAETALENVDMPDSVTEIGANVFSSCTSLTDVKLSASLTRLGAGTFGLCTSLKNVQLPSGLIEIGNNAFTGCSALTAVEIPNTVTTIEEEAFEGCTGLQELTIPASVADIKRGVIRDSGITKVYFERTAGWERYLWINSTGGNNTFDYYDSVTVTDPVKAATLLKQESYKQVSSANKFGYYWRAK